MMISSRKKIRGLHEKWLNLQLYTRFGEIRCFYNADFINVTDLVADRD